MVAIRRGGWGVSTLGDGSALDAVRADGWPSIRVGRLQVLAALAAVGDVSTTYVILTSEEYVEYNTFLDALASEAVGFAMAYFVALNLWYFGLGTLDLGWISNGVVVYHVGVMGSATVNNLVLFAVGESLLDVLGGSAAFQAKTALAAVIAAAVVLRRHGVPPYRELAAAVAFVAVSFAIMH